MAKKNNTVIDVEINPTGEAKPAEFMKIEDVASEKRKLLVGVTFVMAVALIAWALLFPTTPALVEVSSGGFLGMFRSTQELPATTATVAEVVKEALANVDGGAKIRVLIKGEEHQVSLTKAEVREIKDGKRKFTI